MVSPFSNQASDLNAEMVNLQSEKELNSYAKKAVGGKTPKKKSKNGSVSGGNGNEGKTMEVRSRRIIRGELVYDAYYSLMETTVNLALAMMVGLASRWLLGLIRSLKLSVASSKTMSLSGLGGPCCSPYRGSDDEGSRLPGSFERLLSCVLIKQEGDNAGTFLFTLFLLVFLAAVVKLAWSVSAPSTSKDDELDGDYDADNENENREGKGDTPTYRRVNPTKVKRFIVGVGASLFSFWLFQTPALLRMLGLDGLTEAAEEWAARALLFGNLLGFVSLQKMNTSEEPAEPLQNLMNVFLLFLALAWGYIASVMMNPIKETARNAAHILSPSPSKKKGKAPKNPNEMLDLINARMMLLIQAMAPFMIMCTYLFDMRFSETMKTPARGGQMNMTFSKQYLQNSGLFMRVALAWCFVAASSYTFRSLLQSYLDQATTVAAAVSTLGASTSHKSPPKADPFNDRYKNVVLTAGRVAVFPLFILIILAIAHLRGGDGSVHPGVGYESQPRDAPRSVLPVQGLLPPYSDKYMSWIADRSEPHHGEAGAGDALLQVAALSQSSWDITPVRDSAHKKVVNWFGRNKFCYPPEDRSIKAMSRHVNYLLDNNGDDPNEGSLLTMNALTGRELLDMAPPVPATVTDILFNRKAAGIHLEGRCENDSNPEETGREGGPNYTQGKEECKVSEDGARKLQNPSFSEIFSFLVSHNFLTPSVIFPMIDTVAFLSSVWWNYWYSAMMIVYWIKLRGTAALRIKA